MKLIGIILAISLVTVLTGCPSNDYRQKPAKHGDLLPGDPGHQAPNCSADGPGCEQFNPNL